MDFFTVPTLTFGVLYCFFAIGQDRRKILRFNVTKNRNALWIVQQMREAWPYAPAHRFLVFDRDTKFGNDVISFATDMGSQPVRTAFRSPWQNGVAERWVGSCRRDLLDHVIVLNERHLKRLMTEYVRYTMRIGRTSGYADRSANSDMSCDGKEDSLLHSTRRTAPPLRRCGLDSDNFVYHSKLSFPQSRTAGDALSCREPSGRSSASNRLTHHAEESSCPAREVLTNHSPISENNAWSFTQNSGHTSPKPDFLGSRHFLILTMGLPQLEQWSRVLYTAAQN